MENKGGQGYIETKITEQKQKLIYMEEGLSNNKTRYTVKQCLETN